MQTLDQYARTGLIPAPVLASTATDLKDGGSVLNALHRHLGSRTDEVWAQLAQRSNRTFVPHPAAAGPIDARLLPLHLALDLRLHYALSVVVSDSHSECDDGKHRVPLRLSIRDNIA